MKRGDIKAGKVYRGANPKQKPRTVLSVGTGLWGGHHLTDAYVVEYEIPMANGYRKSRRCTLGAFARWAQAEVEP